MTIAHVSWTFTFGGIETMLVNIANEQIVLGHEVHIVVIEHNNVEPTLREKLNPKIRMHYVNRKNGRKDLPAIFRLNRILLSINPDTIHLHSASIYKYLLPQLRKVCNSTLHALCNASNTNFIQKIPRVFAISKIVAKDLEKKKNVNSIVNPNGIKPELIKERKSTDKNDILKIVQVSRLMHETKGQDLLIQAAHELICRGYVHFKIYFIGDGPSLDFLHKQTNDLSMDDKVIFLGAQPQDYIFEHLCEYDLFVQPSRYEGFGNTVTEAMAAKVPVIVSSGQGPEEIVDNGTYGYVFENGNASDLADKIEIFLKKQNDISMIEKAYDRVWNLYNIKVTVKTYIDNYICKKQDK